MIDSSDKSRSPNPISVGRSHALFRKVTGALALAVLIVPSASTAVAAQPAPLQTIRNIACRTMTYGSIANAVAFHPSRSEYLGIPLKDWSPEVSAAVMNRVRECAPELGQRNVDDALRLLPQRLQLLVDAAAVPRSRSASATTEADFECAPSKTRDLTASDQAFLDAAMGPGVRRTARPSTPTILEPGSRDPAEQAAREARRKREAKQQACDDAAQAQADEKARAKLAQQRQEQIVAADASIAARLAQASPEVQAYVERNPTIAKSASGNSDAIKRNLIGLYSADIILRVCRERYGSFSEQVLRLQETIRLTELTYQQIHQMPAAEVAAIRDRLGVDSGQGQLIDYARLSRDLLRGCNEFVALYGLNPPLAR